MQSTAALAICNRFQSEKPYTYHDCKKSLKMLLRLFNIQDIVSVMDASYRYTFFKFPIIGYRHCYARDKNET